jgi:16S rRNA C1402 (ribose-2'-O) methylase RsmI
LRTMHLLDTSTTALERQREAFRRMTPEQRLAVAAEMSDEIRAIAESGIRRRHPDYSDDEIRKELVVILLGREDAARGRARRTSAAR